MAIEPIQPHLPLEFKPGTHNSTFGSIRDATGLTLCFSSPPGQGAWIVNAINRQIEKLRALGELFIQAHQILDEAGVPRYDDKNQKMLLPARIALLIAQRDQLTAELMAPTIERPKEAQTLDV